MAGVTGFGYPGQQTPQQQADAQRKAREAEALRQQELARQQASKNAAVGGTSFTQTPTGTTFGTGSGGSRPAAGTNGGPGNPAAPAMSDEAKMRLAAQLRKEEELRQWARIQEMQKTWAPPQVPGGGVGQTPEEAAAQSAAFGRAKDKIGDISRSAVDSLRNLYAGSGNLAAMNAGLEGMGQEGMKNLSNFSTEQAMQEAARTAQLSDRNYQGGITQRGQDLSMLQSLMGLMRLY